jgi:hypothetical protein
MNRFLSLFIFSFSYVNSFDIYNLFTRKLLYEKSVLQIHMDNIPPSNNGSPTKQTFTSQPCHSDPRLYDKLEI